MSAMSAESKTSPPTKHTALSIAKTPDEPSPYHKSLARPTKEQKWTPAQESLLRALVADYKKLWLNDHREEFWRMVQADMAKEFGGAFASASDGSDDTSDTRYPAERWISERKFLRDYLGITDASNARQANGIGHLDGPTVQNGHSRKISTAVLPDMGSFRKKRKVADGSKWPADEAVVNGGHVNGDEAGRDGMVDTTKPSSAVHATNGIETLPSPPDAVKNEDAMQTEETSGLPDAMANILNSTASPRMSQIYEKIDFSLRELGLLDENTSQDAVFEAYDYAFNHVKGDLDTLGGSQAGLAALLIMLYRLVRDNRNRIMAAESANEKEQTKRKWNDDVLWSMINDKCAQVGLRAGEDLNRLAKYVEDKIPKIRDDIVQVLGGPTLPQMQYINPKMLDCQLTPEEPPLVKHSRSQSLKNGYRDYSNPFERTRPNDVDTGVLVQKMQKLMEQREADAKLIEQQKLVILQMDRRLQYLESRIAGVA